MSGHFSGWAWGGKKWGTYQRLPQDSDATLVTVDIEPQSSFDYGIGIGGGRRGAPSDVVSITIAYDETAPKAPVGVSAASIAGGIKIEWTNPTESTDGSPCNDLTWNKIYYKSTAGVSKADNEGSYLVSGKAGDPNSYIDHIPARTTRYYVVTAIDKTGNESAESDEVHVAAGDVTQTTSIPSDATGLVFDDNYSGDGVVTGDGILGIVFRTPDPSWKNFDHYRLWFQYTDDNGSTWKDVNGNANQWTEIKPVSRFGYVHKGLNTT